MSLDRLPYDLLFNIGLLLDIDSIINMVATCRTFRDLLWEPTLARRITDNWAPFALETKEAVKEATRCEVDYRNVLLDIYRRTNAFKHGRPRIAASLGAATGFVAHQGVICYIRDDVVTIVDTQSSSDPKSFPVFDILPEIDFAVDLRLTASLLHYADDILSVSVQEPITRQTWLVVVQIFLTEDRRPESKICIPLAETKRLFVRNDTDFLYYGTHSYTGSHGHQEWIIQGIALNEQHPFPRNARTTRAKGTKFESLKIQLSDFVGSEIGSSVAFKIHNGWFFAVSNLDEFEVVEVDWTSFYHCFKFPVHDPSKENIKVNHSLYRRQHREGPINDGWLDLDLQVDESTNEVLIVEARKEWLGDHSLQSRTFYFSKLKFTGVSIEDAHSTSSRGNIPENDRFARYASSLSKYAPKEDREFWQVHREEDNRIARHKDGSRGEKDFLLRHTKYQTYSVAANAFIDIVEDTDCCKHNFKNTGRQACLRLRSGARMLGISTSTSAVASSPRKENQETPHPRLDWLSPCDVYTTDKPSPYTYTPVRLWPPPSYESGDAADKHNVLSPIRHATHYGSSLAVQAASDERMIVMLIRNSPSDLVGKLVCLSFDSSAGIERFVGLEDPKLCAGRSRASSNASVLVGGEETATADNGKGKQPVSHETLELGSSLLGGSSSSSSVPWDSSSSGGAWDLDNCEQLIDELPWD